MNVVSRADEALVLLRSGAIDGLSIGFRVVKARADRKLDLRYLLELDLWEISIVTFPMLLEARVTAVVGTSSTRYLTERIKRVTSIMS